MHTGAGDVWTSESSTQSGEKTSQYHHLLFRLRNERYKSHHRLPQLDIEVPAYELPLPEGVGQEQLEGETLSVREIEEMWKEKLIDSQPATDLPDPFTSSN